MLEYKATEKFDIGAGLGVYEYDFFTINGEDDFVALMIHYGTVYRRFNYFLDGYNKKVENNTELSPVVQAKMEEHDANLCLTFIEEKINENNAGIRQMVVNVQKPNGIYETYFSQYYHFDTVSARDYLERGNAYGMSGLYNAAIRHYSHAIKLDPSMGVAFIFRGISYLDMKNYDKAIEDFTQGINFNEEKSTAFSLRGHAYKGAGDFDKARADFAKALELNPDDEMAKGGLEKINEA
jgi:tetratricopeptide (TPR) repeat protein